ncbi:MAG TPA: response regulator transcription factor [Solirubrobacteraceae bacterium]|nr:response regulator transcription factor [Solirubrobacteraceae bacterium]
MTQRNPTVTIVDDQELFRIGIAGLLQERGIRVLGESGMAVDAIRQACELRPDVVLMDLNMPGMSGVEATQRLTAAAPHVRVLVLTVAADERHVMNALLAGACGYLLKEAPIGHIIDGIKAAARGESMISPRIANRLIRRLREPSHRAAAVAGTELTPREHEVLELLARGMGNPDIALALYLSEHTVKNHVSSILAKLQVENRIQAAVRAVRAGIV